MVVFVEQPALENLEQKPLVISMAMSCYTDVCVADTLKTAKCVPLSGSGRQGFHNPSHAPFP